MSGTLMNGTSMNGTSMNNNEPRLVVRELMDARGMRVANLSAMTGLGISTIYNLCSGKTTRLDLRVLRLVAAAFGVPIGALFSDYEGGKQ